MADIRIPSTIKLGGGSVQEVAEQLSQFRCRRPLIVTDPFLMSQGLPLQIRDRLTASGMESGIFSDTVPDPTSKVVEAGSGVFVSGAYDSLVSVGGGSPMDTAKAIGMLAANGGRARDYKVPYAPPRKGPIHVAIPTTAGTGSEVTRFTVISDSETNEKMLIAGANLVPDGAIVDYELTLTMPRRLTADTGTDSLTHAIEAYVSRRANGFSDSFALAAMKTIWEQLPIAFAQGENRAAREAMMLAATQAGLAFSNASVALVHGMSRPMGVHFHIPHGLSNAMLLPAVTAFSLSGAPERYGDCARTMGIAQANLSNEAAAEALVQALYRRNEELEVPTPKMYGIPEADYFELVPTMVAQALASGSPENNPRVATAGEISAIYRGCWSGSAQGKL